MQLENVQLHEQMWTHASHSDPNTVTSEQCMIAAWSRDMMRHTYQVFVEVGLRLAVRDASHRLVVVELVTQLAEVARHGDHLLHTCHKHRVSQLETLPRLMAGQCDGLRRMWLNRV